MFDDSTFVPLSTWGIGRDGGGSIMAVDPPRNQFNGIASATASIQPTTRLHPPVRRYCAFHDKARWHCASRMSFRVPEERALDWLRQSPLL